MSEKAKSKRFFSQSVPIFGSVAMLVLCLVFFLLPFALRGARMAIDGMQNNVADWLPSHYPETKDLEEFRKYFVGDVFVVVSGPWCKEGDPAFINLRRKIYEESLEFEKDLKERKEEEEIRAHRKGDELGLMYTGNYHEDWGEHKERWLLGLRGQWYWINRKGELHRWKGQNNVVEGAKRFVERLVRGKNEAIGTFVGEFGPPPDDEQGIENPFYADPQKLCCRPFKAVTSGPEVFDRMAGPNGTIRIGNFSEESKDTFDAKVEAHQRLTGALFGPTPSKEFRWTYESLLQQMKDDKNRQSQLTSDPIHRERFEKFVQQKVDSDYDGEFNNLLSATKAQKLRLWYEMWFELNIEPPDRQTCLVVTLNKPVLEEMDRAVGRPLLGKPRGRILELATGECGISSAKVHIGGPPADNVAIDEEGTSTLLRLVGLSMGIGIGLAYFSFRSFRITAMLFFVGGVAAISSLSYVWYAGNTMDAILMSMPSLVFVLGLSGAVHVVNYYRDACFENGRDGAVEAAVKHGLFPCSLAAFTTALGLVSLCASNLTPIKKFGFFSAIAVCATVVLLFTYLPAALTIWKADYDKLEGKGKDSLGGISGAVARFWNGIGQWVLGHYRIVMVCSLLVMAFFAYGITKIETSVHLLKLFDPSAKILRDYHWLEENLGELVPAELVVWVDEDAQEVVIDEPEDGDETAVELSLEQKLASDLDYSMLERAELSQRVRLQLERFFGPDGLGIIGTGMSTDVFAPLHRVSSKPSVTRRGFNIQLTNKRDEMIEEDYLAVAGKSNISWQDALEDKSDPEKFGREMWRISIRLAALNDVDYGQFISDMKAVVEPTLTAYRKRTEILKRLHADLGDQYFEDCKILVLGFDPDSAEYDRRVNIANDQSVSEVVDQTFIFADTLQDLLENRGICSSKDKEKVSKNRYYVWFDPSIFVNKPDATEEEKAALAKKRDEFKVKFDEELSKFDLVVVVEDSPHFGFDSVADSAKAVVDCRDHKYLINPRTKQPVEGMLTAAELSKVPGTGDDVKIGTIYTGIVPIVYKAQRSLLESLIRSIMLAFAMIAVVMMLLLRDWSRPVGLDNSLNIRGGMLSMLPNVFPVVLIFGAMGHLGVLVDIGSMMTASVAMGVAVDDTIHFLNWYRHGLAQGMRRKQAIELAYDRVASAMTQTTLIGGLGLFAFALSTFTPTQRFGVLMLFLLSAALIGDLIFLPAILASPLGRFFGKELPEDKASSLRILSDELPDVHPDSLKHLESPESGSGDLGLGNAGTG